MINPENKLARPHPKAPFILWHQSEKPNCKKENAFQFILPVSNSESLITEVKYNDSCKSHYREKNHTIRTLALGGMLNSLVEETASVNYHGDEEQARDFGDSNSHNADSSSCVVSSLDEGEKFVLGMD